MAHRTAPAPTAAEHPRTELPDLETMRVSVRHALAEDPQAEELMTLAETLRGHMRVLMPEVSELAARQPRNAMAAVGARAAIQEADRKLRVGDGGTQALRLALVQRLARCVDCLCRHYENLGGQA